MPARSHFNQQVGFSRGFISAFRLYQFFSRLAIRLYRGFIDPDNVMRGSLYPDVSGQLIRHHLHDRAYSIDDDAAADLVSHVLLDAEQGRPKASSSGVSGADVGSVIVCLDILTAPEFGEDYRVFPTGPKFQGATFLLLGLHQALLRSREQKYGFWQDFFVATHRSLCASGACKIVMSVAALLVSVAIALELIAG
ncbi:a1-alpha2 repression [Phytophthora pseudosyringae]|uniref:A1-alpha2 repression n=1 Tax=Phytophthora pseudosyringae TaxID=221518 RepID=A0A8T1VQX9_9STRA|nr:a1-alpha2 repression [Phytophthora pseudosyringae]